MKALSLKQPYAELVIQGKKKIELIGKLRVSAGIVIFTGGHYEEE